jgi:hypothetical protein
VCGAGFAGLPDVDCTRARATGLAGRRTVIDACPCSPVDVFAPEGVRTARRRQARWLRLGLDLLLDASRLRFFYGSAPLLEADELIAKLGAMMNEVIAHEEAAERRADELASRLRAEEQQLRAEEQRLRAEADARLAEALAEVARLKRGR